jgi:hypothetical protein
MFQVANRFQMDHVLVLSIPWLALLPLIPQLSAQRQLDHLPLRHSAADSPED